MIEPAILALATGQVFHGRSIGVLGQSVGEVVFNTAMTGYQEILTDPSYAKQIITLTYPHIGNVGTNSEDNESERVWASGLVVADLSLTVSNWRSQQSLPEFLQQHHVVAIADIDTRALTRLLRDHGVINGCIQAGVIDEKAAINAAREFAGLQGMDLAKDVSTQKTYEWSEGQWQWSAGFEQTASSQAKHVVVYDFGVKRNILRKLVSVGCRLTVVPATTPATDVLALKPDGIFLSNGPGDPAACSYAIENIKQLLPTKIPIFGICLGHQLLALACGAKTIKMKFGHQGANHPVQNLKNKTVLISSQNHGFTVDTDSLPPSLVATHQSLFDKTLQGIRHQELPAFSFQGHPEASPGPHDVDLLFAEFYQLMVN